MSLGSLILTLESIGRLREWQHRRGGQATYRPVNVQSETSVATGGLAAAGYRLQDGDDVAVAKEIF